MPNNNLEITADGSHSIFSDKFQALYHSKHGAIQESMHVFIEAGYKYLDGQNLRILEMGFGTGLNALLTYIESQKSQRRIEYVTVEAYPIEIAQFKELNYLEQLRRTDLVKEFEVLHTSPWNEQIELDSFLFMKLLSKLEDVVFSQKFDLVYYDAFAPLTQEELWTPEIFQHIGGAMNTGGVLVSYCAKGSFKRALQSAGFTIEKIPGPPGKREMIRGTYG